MSISFKSWDSPASSTYSGRRSTSAYKALTTWKELDWEGLSSQCDTAFKVAKAEADAERLDKYNAFIANKEREREAINPEGGSYEGNLTDEYPLGVMGMRQLLLIKQKATADIIESFCVSNNLKARGTQLLALLVTYIGSFKLSTIAGEDYDPKLAEECYRSGCVDGLLSGKALYKQIFVSAEGQGLYYFLMSDSRSNYLETQYKGTARNYCALVPLVMYAFKLIKGISYHHWARSEIRGIVNPKLADAMLWDELEHPKPPLEDIALAREEGLKVKSGAKAGQIRSPVFTYKLYGAGILKDLPDYVQVMYTQIWCAHPENRTKYMILDPSNWDTVPKPLFDADVIETKPAPEFGFEKQQNPVDLPW